MYPSYVAQSVMSPTVDPGVVSLITTQSHTLEEIDREKISPVILVPWCGSYLHEWHNFLGSRPSGALGRGQKVKYHLFSILHFEFYVPDFGNFQHHPWSHSSYTYFLL